VGYQTPDQGRSQGGDKGAVLPPKSEEREKIGNFSLKIILNINIKKKSRSRLSALANFGFSLNSYNFFQNFRPLGLEISINFARAYQRSQFLIFWKKFTLKNFFSY
jgi:hypothetical protein